jgi:hypothetical protein
MSIAPAPAPSIPRCEQGALIMTEQETSAPSTAEANIATYYKDTIAAFEAYVAAVGKVAHGWNYLHEQLGCFSRSLAARKGKSLSQWLWCK